MLCVLVGAGLWCCDRKPETRERCTRASAPACSADGTCEAGKRCVYPFDEVNGVCIMECTPPGNLDGSCPSGMTCAVLAATPTRLTGYVPVCVPEDSCEAR